MAVSVGGAGGAETPMSDINTTPLVDVMLVLLIIFLIAVPVAIQTIEKLKVPDPSLDRGIEGQGRKPAADGDHHRRRRAAAPASRAMKVPRATANAASISTTSPRSTSEELRDQAFKRLDAIVKREGGPEACGPTRKRFRRSTSAAT
jgi:biopolymer transport protein ExbD